MSMRVATHASLLLNGQDTVTTGNYPWLRDSLTSTLRIADFDGCVFGLKKHKERYTHKEALAYSYQLASHPRSIS